MVHQCGGSISVVFLVVCDSSVNFIHNREMKDALL